MGWSLLEIGRIVSGLLALRKDMGLLVSDLLVVKKKITIRGRIALNRIRIYNWNLPILSDVYKSLSSSNGKR